MGGPGPGEGEHRGRETRSVLNGPKRETFPRVASSPSLLIALPGPCPLRWDSEGGCSENQVQRLGARPAPAELQCCEGGRALEAPGFATLLPPSHRPPQQVISVKTGRLAVLLIIHEASSAPIRRAGRGGEAAPAPGENTRLLGACLASREGYRKGGLACFSHLLCACLTHSNHKLVVPQ